jgi:hypothetical protein
MADLNTDIQGQNQQNLYNQSKIDQNSNINTFSTERQVKMSGQFETAIRQAEELVHKDYKIASLEEKLNSIEAKTEQKVNSEWEMNLSGKIQQAKKSANMQYFWMGLAIGVILTFIFFGIFN